MSGSRFLLLLAACALLPLAARTAPVTLEYIAHACFVVESPTGTRIAIDPFNGNRWLGYSFPEKLEAEAVLVTHPHYDHDASYYFPGAPVFRRPGRFSIGDVRVTGVAGKHADPYGKEFGQANSLWVVETGGIRIAHLGDTGPLTPEMVRGLGRVDVLLIPVDGDEHILKYTEIDAILAALRPKVTVPMHYRLTSLSELPASLGPLAPWLDRNPSAVRQPSHRTILSADRIARPKQVWILPPSPDVRPWPARLHQAESERAAARSVSGDEAISHLRKAAALAPNAIRYAYELGRALAEAERDDEAVGVLEETLSRASRMDYEFTILSRTLLGSLYASRGQKELAATQFRIVQAESHWTEPRAIARKFLEANQ